MMRLVHCLVFVACIAPTVLGAYVSEEETCECVPLNRCFTQVHIIDIRNTTGGCSHYLDTCCTQIKPLTPRPNRRGAATINPLNAGTINPRNLGTIDPRNNGTIDPRNDGTINPRNRGTIDPRNNGTIDPRNNGTIDPRNDGTINPRNRGTIDPRNNGTIDPRNAGTINPRNRGTIDPRNNGTIDLRNDGTINPRTLGTEDPQDTKTDDPRDNVTLSVQFRNSPGGWRVESRPKPPPPSRIRLGCGQRNPNGAADYRIVNNVEGQTQFAEWPWMVAVVTLTEDMETNEKSVMEYHCGGSLIHPKVVLSAAHCVNRFKTSPRQLKVLLGEWDTQTENEEIPIQEKKVQELIIHEQFNMGTLINDVALLILHGQAMVADNVDTICLPRLATQPRAGTKCFATGWGKDRFGKEGYYQVILKSIELPIVSSSDCQDSLRTTRLSKFFKLHESFVCAGGQSGVDTCKGDGGGPLVCPVDGREGHYEQVGVVSWGIGCGEAGVPGVYADMTLFRAWVDAKMTDKQMEKSWYSWDDEDVEYDANAEEGEAVTGRDNLK